MKLKIALSASFYNVQAVYALLDTCERIYTTQTRNLQEIVDLFGADRVRGVPDGTRETQEWIMDRERRDMRLGGYTEIEFVTYSDLLKISHVTDERLQVALEELETQKSLVQMLRKEVLDLQEDQRRLNYLATLGQYEHNGHATNTWAVTGSGSQSLRDVLDRMRRGLSYDAHNKPIVPDVVYNRVPTVPMTLSPQLDAAVHTSRDPLVQDHAVIASVGLDYRGENP